MNLKKLFNISRKVQCPKCRHQNKNVLKYVDPFDIKIDASLVIVELNCDECATYYDVHIRIAGVVVSTKYQE